MLMYGLIEEVALFAKANSMQWYGFVLRKQNGNVLMALDFIADQRSKEQGMAWNDMEEAGKEMYQGLIEDE